MRLEEIEKEMANAEKLRLNMMKWVCAALFVMVVILIQIIMVFDISLEDIWIQIVNLIKSVL